MNELATADPLAGLRGFQHNPARADRDVRAALRFDFGAFLDVLLGDSSFGDDDPAFQFAIAILIKSKALPPAIATPSITSFAQAARLTRCILGLDNNFINVLLTAVLNRLDMTNPACALRVLDLVAEFPGQPVNWRSLVRMHADGDKAIKRKCVVLMARLRFGNSAAIESFKRCEPRIRANIVEALWNAEGERTNACVEVAIQDEDNRVAGNACLALYNAGDTRALARLAEMLKSAEPKSRITAAWVMGQCRDGRFASRLLEAMRDESPALRKTAIASLAKIEAIPACVSASRKSEPGDVRLCFASAPHTVPESQGFELWLRASGLDGDFAQNLRPIDFFVWAGAELLLDYSVEEAVGTGDVAVRIVYPAGSESFKAALKDSLAGKPAAQVWALSTYGTASEKSGTPAAPRFEADASILGSLLESVPVPSAAAAEAVNKALAAESGISDQHLVLVLEAPASEADALQAICQEKKIRFHCWGPGSCELGSWPPPVVRDVAQWASIWPQFLASLGARYVIRTRKAPTAVAVRSAGTKPPRFSPRANLTGDVSK